MAEPEAGIRADEARNERARQPIIPRALEPPQQVQREDPMQRRIDQARRIARQNIPLPPPNAVAKRNNLDLDHRALQLSLGILPPQQQQGQRGEDQRERRARLIREDRHRNQAMAIQANALANRQQNRLPPFGLGGLGN